MEKTVRITMDEVQVGDEVAIPNSYSSSTFTFDTVARILKTTIVLESGRRFDRWGEERKSKVNAYISRRYNSRLYTPEFARERIAENEARHCRVSEVKALIAAIDGRRSYNGNVYINEENMAIIRDLTERLAQDQDL